MSRRALCSIAWGLISMAGVACGLAGDEPTRLEIRLIEPEGTQGRTLRDAVGNDLARTPLRHQVTLGAAPVFDESSEVGRLLAVLELGFDPALARPRVEFARAGDELSPGWLVHAVLRSGATVGVETEVIDSRSSWFGQLIRRSTRRGGTGTADSALALGVPAVSLVLPSADEAATKLLAATVRRLDGLDGYPLFEDEFLVVGQRVLLRRDLYWIGLIVWLALYWRGRKQPGREFRWLLLAAWLVAPVYASLLLVLPAAVATWRPAVRWPAAASLLPVAVFAVLLAISVGGPSALVVSGLPALLVVLALAAFIWHHLIRPPQIDGVAP